MTSPSAPPEFDVSIKYLLINLKHLTFQGNAMLTPRSANAANHRREQSHDDCRWYREKEAVQAIASTAPLDLLVPSDE